MVSGSGHLALSVFRCFTDSLFRIAFPLFSSLTYSFFVHSLFHTFFVSHFCCFVRLCLVLSLSRASVVSQKIIVLYFLCYALLLCPTLVVLHYFCRVLFYMEVPIYPVTGCARRLKPLFNPTMTTNQNRSFNALLSMFVFWRSITELNSLHQNFMKMNR